MVFFRGASCDVSSALRLVVGVGCCVGMTLGMGASVQAATHEVQVDTSNSGALDGRVPWWWQPQGRYAEPGTVRGGAPEGVRAVSPVAGWTPPLFTAAMGKSLNSSAAHPALRGRTSVMVAGVDGTPQWSLYSGTPRVPASTQKLVTAFNALTTLTGERRFTTDVRWVSGVSPEVFLVGGGDPTLTWDRLSVLASDTAAALKQAGVVSVALTVDDTLFPEPTMATGWVPVDYTVDVQRIRALTYAGYRGEDGAMAVAQGFAWMLGKQGITVTPAVRGKAPVGAVSVASSQSPTVADIVKVMLNISQNDFAEYLYRHVAIAEQQPPSWVGAQKASLAVLGRAGVPVTGYQPLDGSGLTQLGRMPVGTLTSVLAKLYANPALNEVAFAADAMPRSGQSGTLRKRFQSAQTRCAQGKVWAKTGTMEAAIALAGIVHSADGQPRIMVIMENGNRNLTALRGAVDAVATSVVGCRLTPPA